MSEDIYEFFEQEKRELEAKSIDYDKVDDGKRRGDTEREESRSDDGWIG